MANTVPVVYDEQWIISNVLYEQLWDIRYLLYDEQLWDISDAIYDEELWDVYPINRSIEVKFRDQEGYFICF